MKYQLISYDVWGNARDGFDVNQAFTTNQFIELNGDESDRTINRRLGFNGLTWDGEPGYALYATVKRNGMPACELRAVA